MIVDIPLVGLTFGASLAIALLATPVVILIARKTGCITKPGGRRIHKQPTPFLGGIAIYVAFMIPITFLVCKYSALNVEFSQQFMGLLLAGGVIVLLGLWDDIKEISPYTKLLGQIVVALILFLYGFRVGVITNPFVGPNTPLPFYVGAIITVMWIIGLMNAMNLIDGLDGLAAGITVIVCGSLFFVSMHMNNVATLFLLAALAGSTLGFLRYNFHPAKIFMGDTGSLFLGMILAVAALTGSQHKSTAATALLVPFAALAIPIADTFLAIVRRGIRHAPIFSADKKHLHHRLLAMGVGQRQIVVALYMITLYLGGFAFLFVLIPERYALILLCLLTLGALMGVRLLGFMERSIKIAHKRETERVMRRQFEKSE